MVVVFPAPEGPRKPKISPSFTAKLRPSSARVLPKERDTFCMDRMSIGGSLLSVNDIILPKKKQSCYKNAVKGASQTANGALRGMNGAETIAVFRRRPFISGAKIPPKAHKADTGIRIETISCTIPAAYAARAGTAFIFARHTRLLCQNRYCRRMASMRPLLSGTPDSGPFSSRSA